MNKILFFYFSLLFLSFDSFSQHQNELAIGFKFGEPMGLNVRKYYKNGDNALDFNVGTYGFLWRKTEDYRKGRYDGAGFSFQVNNIINRQVFNFENFFAYIGYGGQLNIRKYYEKNQNTGTYDRDSGKTNFSIGPDGLAGLQFNIQDKLFIFFEGGIYVELLPKPLFYFPQANTGFRIHIDN